MPTLLLSHLWWCCNEVGRSVLFFTFLQSFSLPFCGTELGLCKSLLRNFCIRIQSNLGCPRVPTLTPATQAAVWNTSSVFVIWHKVLSWVFSPYECVSRKQWVFFWTSSSLLSSTILWCGLSFSWMFMSAVVGPLTPTVTCKHTCKHFSKRSSGVLCVCGFPLPHLQTIVDSGSVGCDHAHAQCIRVLPCSSAFAHCLCARPTQHSTLMNMTLPGLALIKLWFSLETHVLSTQELRLPTPTVDPLTMFSQRNGKTALGNFAVFVLQPLGVVST